MIGRGRLMLLSMRRAMLPVFDETENPFPGMSEAMDLEKEKNFFEPRVIEYRNGGAPGSKCRRPVHARRPDSPRLRPMT
jgi:hypothetical protein